MTEPREPRPWPSALDFPLQPLPAFEAAWRVTLRDLVTPQGLASGLELAWLPQLSVIEGHTRYQVNALLLIEPDEEWVAMSVTNAAEIYWGQVLYRATAAGVDLGAVCCIEAYLNGAGKLRSLSRVVLSKPYAGYHPVVQTRSGGPLPLFTRAEFVALRDAMGGPVRSATRILLAQY